MKSKQLILVATLVITMSLGYIMNAQARGVEVRDVLVDYDYDISVSREIPIVDDDLDGVADDEDDCLGVMGFAEARGCMLVAKEECGEITDWVLGTAEYRAAHPECSPIADEDGDRITNRYDACWEEDALDTNYTIGFGCFIEADPVVDPSSPTDPSGEGDGEDDGEGDGSGVDLNTLDFFSREYEEIVDDTSSDQEDGDVQGEAEGNGEGCSLISGGSGSSAISGIILLLSLAPLAIRRRRNK